MKKIIKKFNKKIAFVLLVIFFCNFIFSFKSFSNKISVEVENSLTKKIYPIGRCIGLKLYTNGVLVIGMSEITGLDGKNYKPYEKSGITEGDMIKSINGNEIKNTNELVNILNSSNGNELSIKYEKNNEEIYTTIKPVLTKNGYMIGLWVRDAAAGIGTLTYYDESTSRFGALGHGIIDVDTDKLLHISNGQIVTTQIISIVKAKQDNPGEIRGIIDNGTEIGQISSNTNIGIYGNVTNKKYIDSIKTNEIPVANRNQIKKGKAKIMCELENNKVQEYEIEIKKIYKSSSNEDNKNMLIKVTDPNLLNITGGIIPGMSGSPIIQNGKFIGAVTNVLLNDPTTGYAIFADSMIK